MAAAIWTCDRAQMRRTGLVLLLALMVVGCDRKNPLYLVPGKEEPPPGTENTPKQTGPASTGARHVSPPAR